MSAPSTEQQPQATAQPSPVEDVFVLSPLQLGMLFQTRLAPESGVFYQQLATPLPGRIDDDAFEAAWRGLIAATPALRTSFHWDDLEHPVQVVHRHVDFAVDRLDWTNTPTRSVNARLDQHLAHRRAAGFDLERAPLMAVDLIAMPRGSRWFVWHFHHLLLDGWSSRLLMDEFTARYIAAVERRRFVASPRPSFRTYLEWLQRQDEGEAERFWRTELTGISSPTPLNLPRHRDAAPTEHVVELSVEATTALGAFARRERVTLNTVLQGAWALLLSRYSDTDDVLFGSVVSGRTPEIAGVEDIIGLFINSLPTRVAVDDEATLGPWLRAVQTSQSKAMQFDFASPMQISQWSEFPAGTRLYDTVLIFENFPNAVPDETPSGRGGAGRTLTGPSPQDFGQTDLPLSVLVLPGARLRLTLRSDGQTVDAHALRLISQHLATLLERMPVDPDVPLGDLSTPDERQPERLGEPDDERSVLDLFGDRLAHAPEAVPLVASDGVTATYAELAERIDRLAAALIRRGIAIGDIVGVNLPRSIDSVAATLAIWSVGAVYLPLDPAYPDARLEFMARDSGAACVIGQRRVGDVDNLDPATVDDESSTPASRAHHRTHPDELAYVLYTSGSTGTPKGVGVEHRVVLNRLQWMWRAFPFGPDDVNLMRTSSNFVDALWEMLGGLLGGAPTAIASDDDVADPALLVDLARRHDVSRIFLVPSYLDALLERCPDVAARAPRLTTWFVGGESLTDELADRFHRAMPNGELYNIYGSTELWDVTVQHVTPESLGTGRVSIGHPIDGVDVSILDSRARPVPHGVIGRMCVGGAALPRGYLDDELTHSRITSDADTGARRFDTGDLAHMMPDGSIHVHGRRDGQLKVRGQRVEPGEVEAVLESHDQIRSAAVVMGRPDRPEPDDGTDDRRLVAYLVGDRPGTDTGEIRSLVAERLPRSMMPAHFVWIDDIPSTPSGKKDRLALAERPIEHRPTDPTTSIDGGLAAVVSTVISELLGLDAIDPDDHFFADLGGHSLLAVRLCSRLEDAIGVALPIRDVFDHPTAALLTRRLESQRAIAGTDDIDSILAQLDDLDPDEIEALLAEVESTPEAR